MPNNLGMLLILFKAISSRNAAKIGIFFCLLTYFSETGANNLHLFECLVQITHNIFNIFNTHRKANQSVGDPRPFPCLLIHF